MSIIIGLRHACQKNVANLLKSTISMHTIIMGGSHIIYAGYIQWLKEAVCIDM